MDHQGDISFCNPPPPNTHTSSQLSQDMPEGKAKAFWKLQLLGLSEEFSSYVGEMNWVQDCP